jgi:hypothetical protein
MNPESPDANAAPQAPAAGAALSRRGLLRAGAAATPVLLTFASGPVAASGTTSCVIGSAFGSVASLTSHNGGSVTVSCTTNGQRCEQWQQKASSNPCKDTLVTRPAKSCLGIDPPASLGCNLPASPTCKDILSKTQTPDTSTNLGVCQHFVALINNCDSGGVAPVPGFDKAYLQAAFSDYCKSNFPRSSSVKWNAPQTIAWLRVMLGYAVS